MHVHIYHTHASLIQDWMEDQLYMNGICRALKHWHRHTSAMHKERGQIERRSDMQKDKGICCICTFFTARKMTAPVRKNPDVYYYAPTHPFLYAFVCYCGCLYLSILFVLN